MNRCLDRVAVVSALIVLTLSSGLPGQRPQVLRDINATPDPMTYSSEPGHFAQLGDELYFSAFAPTEGFELRAFDLNSRSVRTVRELIVGEQGGFPFGMTAALGAVYFSAYEGPPLSGRRVAFRTDGTSAGTVPAFDLAGDLGGWPSQFGEINGRLVFVADVAQNGNRELFVSDGTSAGTSYVDIYPGSGSSFPYSFVACGGYLYFDAKSPAHGRELWRTDGTVQGTELFHDSQPGPADGDPGQCVQVGSRLLWATNGGLWSSDGTVAGTVLAEPLLPRHVVSTGSLGFFSVGNQLYTTDGVPGGAQLVGGFAPAGSIARMGSFGNHVWIHGSGVSGVSDGTAQGTVELPGRIGSHVELGGKLFFQATQPGASSALWSTDGTVAGTGPVTATPAPGGFGAENLFAVPSSGEVFYSANSLAGRELFVSDGTAAGTGLAANIAREGLLTLDSSPSQLVDAAGTAFFLASDGSQLRLYRTDGTTSGTVPAFPLGAAEPTVGLSLAAVGTRVFFAATDAAAGTELWRANGDGGAPERVLDIVPGPGGSFPRSLHAAEDSLFFTTQEPPFTRRLWRTTGHAASTMAVPGIASYLNFGVMASFGRGLVFACDVIGAGIGEEPYYTDGTQQGTVLLGDFVLGPVGSGVRDITPVGERCFFTVQGEEELVVTDGTVAGTIRLTQGMSDPPRVMRKLTAFGDKLIFQAYRPAEGVELWVSDGTAAGTHVWFESLPGADGLSAYNLTPLGDLLLCNASIGGTSRRMYRTDGTAAGTFALSTEEFFGLVQTGDRYGYFSARGPEGLELWRTDGTVAGTSLYADVLPGLASSNARFLVHSSGKLLFSAQHRELGIEPWVLDLDASHQSVGFGCSSDGSPAPEMRGQDPVLGTTVSLEVSGGPDPGLSLALISATTTQSSWIGIGYCQRFVEPGSIGFHFDVFTSGRTTHPLMIPNTASLEGIAVRTQALVLGVGGLADAELSNGVTLTLGY